MVKSEGALFEEVQFSAFLAGPLLRLSLLSSVIVMIWSIGSLVL